MRSKLNSSTDSPGPAGLPASLDEFLAQQRAAAARAAQRGKLPPGEAFFGDRVNIYVCDTCFGHIVTRDIDDGVTPFMIACVLQGCHGAMRSSFYRVFDPRMKATHVWAKPDEGQHLSSAERQHVAQDGLLLREVRS